ncbi:MAG: hypothetical protein IJF21_04635 [Clostridia bacterium]|nr:hypothetical protein [Clostridia bacterium]MBQ3227561.1 hypothetical protein [Clostridia bacterium]
MKKQQNNYGEHQSVKEAVNAFNWKRALILVLTTIVSMGIYFFLTSTPLWKVAVLAYIIIASVLIIAYFIINRAFTGSGVTYEMLPDTMTHKEKEEYLADVADRERRSRPMLMVIFPIIVTLLVDLFRLFVLDGFFGN